MPELELKWAINQYQGGNSRKLAKLATEYYNGDHRLKLATQNWAEAFAHLFKEFSDNLCPVVVDSLVERLKITGWESSEAETNQEAVTPPSGIARPVPYQKVTIKDDFATQAEDLWCYNLMGQRSNQIHTEAIKTGNSYLLIWPNADMDPEFWPQTDAEMSVYYDPNALGVIIRASKLWWLPEDKKWRLNVYTPGMIEKYITHQASPNGVPNNTREWVPFADPRTGPTVDNPYGVVPVFHFANKATYACGVTDLRDVIPIQDALNKSLMDMLVSMEFASYKQRYIIGLEPEINEETGNPEDQSQQKYGVDRMMAIPGTKDEVSVGEFQATDLSQFREVSNDFRAEVSRVGGVPLHYLFITTGDYPSGEAIKSAEARFEGRIEGRQEDWKPAWGAAMKFALSLTQTLPDDFEINPIWKDAVESSASESADVAVKKQSIGVSRTQLLREQGYTEDQILQMLQESDAEKQYASTLAMQEAQAAHPPAPSGGASSASVDNARRAKQQGRVPGVR